VARIGIVGGTGPLGRGLAARWAQAGLEVSIGSRDPDRARAAADEVASRIDAPPGTVEAGTNVEVAAHEVVVLCVPWSGLEATLPDLVGPTAGRIVVCTVNPLAFDADGPYAPAVDGGSVAQQVAAALPQASVVGAFHSVSARVLADLDAPVDDHVPVVADDDEAAARVAELASAIAGCRGVVVGPLRLAATLEVLTPVLISVNRRYGTHAGIRFSRL
jgi:8-hydroxy-5-deazaflavin:NADPH oxidoreductase